MSKFNQLTKFTLSWSAVAGCSISKKCRGAFQFRVGGQAKRFVRSLRLYRGNRSNPVVPKISCCVFLGLAPAESLKWIIIVIVKVIQDCEFTSECKRCSAKAV